MQPLIIPSSFDAYMSGAQAKEQATQAKRQKQFGELISQSFTAENKNPLLQQAAALNPQGALQFGQYFQDQSQIQQKQAEEKDKQQALSTLRKVEVLDTAPADRIVPLYQQIAPEHYAQVTQQLGRPPTPQEIKETIAMHKADLYAKSGIDPIKQTQGPSSVQEWRYYSSLPPDQQSKYLEMKRSQNPYQFVEYAGGKGAFNKSNATVTPITNASTENTASRNAAEQTNLGKEDAQRYSSFINEGLSAADSMPIVNRALELLDTVKTGGIDAARLAATNLLGVTGANEAELSNNLGKAVLSQLRSTFGAQFTEREGARLQALEAGFGKSTEGNKRILGQVKKIVERSARRGLDAAERTGDKFSADEIRSSLNMRLAPEKPTQPQQQEITATGPNGQKIVLRNGQWVPYGQ